VKGKAMLRKEIISKKSENFQAVQNLINAAFPPAEQAPMWFLLHRSSKENIKFNAYYDEEVLVGITYLIIHNQICYVTYLAVESTLQSKGYGTQILDKIKSDYPNYRIVLGIEEEEEDAENNEQRRKRRQFYERNGFSSSGNILKFRAVPFDLLVYGGQCTIKEFFELHKKFLGAIVSTFVKPKMIVAS